MKRVLLVLLAMGLVAEGALAICSLPRPGVPPGGGGGGPPTPGPGGTVTPGGGGGPITRPGRRRGVDYSPTWRIWWELNREYLFGLRKPFPPELDGGEGETVADPTAGFRTKVRTALREVALDTRENKDLRSTALRSLGRAGIDVDAKLFLRILRTRGQPAEIYEGAVLGLASLRRIKDAALREEARAWFGKLLKGSFSLPGRSHLIAVLACGLRARHDEALVPILGERLRRGAKKAEDAAAILLACGLSRSEFLTGELVKAVESGRLGQKNLHDISRSHAVLALALCGGGKTALTLAKLLVAKNIQVHTRRSTALGLSLLLREGSVDGVSDKDLRRALVYCFEKEYDPLVKGYCAIAMGAAKKPFLTGLLMKLVGKTGSAALRPYAALALGLAARTLGGEESQRIREFLMAELPDARNFELAGALTIAIGLARATEARAMLVARIKDPKLVGAVRGPACQALGILGEATPKIEKMLVGALEDRSHDVVEDAALALGLLGTKGAGPLLVKKLVETRSQPVLIHMVVALSHLRAVDSINPLLEVVRSRSRDFKIRSSAAAALGILLDPRERDPLFEIDAYANPFGLTEATRELVRIY